MLLTKAIANSWGIGLSGEQAAFLRDTLGDDHHLALYQGTVWPGDDTKQHGASAAPHVVWVSSGGLKELSRLPQALAHHSEPAIIALLLDEDYTLEDFERACDYGISEIIRPPLKRERVADIMRRALEFRAVNSDIDCMTREIVLERELLERKNEILSFLVNFLTNTTESLDLEQLLQTAFSGLRHLLPLRGMHAALWETGSASPPTVTLYINSDKGAAVHDAWRAALMNQTRLALGERFVLEDVRHLPLRDNTAGKGANMPGNGSLLTLPLVCGSERLGVLMLLMENERHLGRDQARALDSAMRHFALSVKNANRFRLMQMYADYDALTKVHSRRHFDNRLEEEMQRFSRYGQPLSVLMLDIDHFKIINDSRGHHVGDLALREVASLLNDSIRSTDYCARYGGEEFVILLPYTGSKKASSLAERIRNRIACHTFLADGGEPLSVTVSIGVSNLSRNSPKNKQTLLCDADAALYAAKIEGRNRTCNTPGSLLSMQSKSKAG